MARPRGSSSRSSSRDHGLRDLPVLLGGALGLRVGASPLQLDHRSELGPAVACARGRSNRVLEHCPRGLPFATAHRRAPELREEHRSLGVLGGQEVERPPEHHDRRWEVLPGERPPPGGREQVPRLAGESERVLVGRDELAAVARRLLQVIAGDLVVLAQASPVPGLLLEPAGKALVQLGADRFRNARVGLVADQRVPEAIRILTGYLGLCRHHEALADERHEPAGHVGLVCMRRQGDERTRPELLPDDRRPLEHPPFRGLEAVDAGGEQRVDRGRKLEGVGRLGVRRHRRKLLGEEWVALGGRRDAS